jgi:hypothetical protein
VPQHASPAVELEQTVHALDSSNIDLCLVRLTGALFQEESGAVKLHTMLDLRGSIPACHALRQGRCTMPASWMSSFPPGSIYVLDPG